jgi:RNA polymerase sigma-70 factor (ECF subfamily)
MRVGHLARPPVNCDMRSLESSLGEEIGLLKCDLDAMSDLSQITKIAADGDDQAFRQLFEKFAPLVKSFMMRQGADIATAEELAQETLITVWKKASLYSSDKGSVSTWIFTIARNLRIDRLRKEEQWVALPGIYEEVPSQEDGPDEVVSLTELELAMRRALTLLPQEQREVVTLSFIEGLAHSEIANRIGLPVGTVKSRLRLAYAKLRATVGRFSE